MKTLIVFQDEPLTNQTHIVDRDQIGNILERLNVRRFSSDRIEVSCTISYDIAIKKARVGLFIRAKATTVTAYQCFFSFKETTKFCRKNTNTNYPRTTKFIRKQND